MYLRFRPSANVGSKNITVTVVHADSTEKEFRYQTDAEYLGKVLEDEQLVEGDQGQYGLFITVADGGTGGRFQTAVVVLDQGRGDGEHLRGPDAHCGRGSL